MKINRVKGKNEKEMSRKGSFFMNIYYFLVLYRYIALLILGLALSAFIFLLVLDFLAPNELSAIDRKATLKLFNELQEANRHQDAILLMEYKGNTVLKDSPLEIEYKSKLADSYIHVGDYSKAEKMLIDVQNHSSEYLKDLDEDILKKYPQMDVFLNFSLARTVYQFYEKVGDRKNQKKYFNIYKSYYDQCDDKIDSLSIVIYNDRTWFHKMSTLNSKELITYDSIVVASFDNEEKAIELMSRFVNQVIDRNEFGPSYKVKCLNKLIGWQLNNDKVTEAYVNIARAVDLVRNMKFVDEYVHLGELSDYCYQIHDIETSKSLFKKYQQFLDERYEKSDFEYLSNYARSFRYLEAENKWEQLNDELEEYCIGMRRQIALNIPSMTEDQREFFAEKFDIAYNYAFHLLQVHPNDRLADLCFDNVSFKNGLLLRSNRTIENSILALNDPEVEKKYQELKECRLNLMYQSVSKKTFFNNREKTEARIDELEKELALKCTDFKTKNDIEQNSHSSLQSKLTKDETIVEMIECNNDLCALILDEKKHVTYIPIGNLSQIQDKLQRPIFEIYHDETLTDIIWNKIAQVVKGKKTVFYVPVGLFNQLAVGALYVGDNQYLSDNYDMRLLSNPSDIIERHPLDLTASTTKISLWGGIDYGMNADIVQKKQNRSAIYRGETLSNLRYAFREVTNISQMLSGNNIKNTVFSSNNATEKAFKERTREKDYIIHVSTHGFFNEKSDLHNSMMESGLFFAGANKYWSNDSISLEWGEEDGILRAAEIAQLNLSGCSLVVLSACETGLGFSDTSEGVYGLQRAFKLAGADMVLMSLWEVDDQATAMLMTEFYKNLLAGKDVDNALELGKRAVRRQYPSPEDWGGFVLLH